MITRRGIFKLTCAAVVAPAALLWPKLAQGLNLAPRLTEAKSEPPKVAMTTWWWRCVCGHHECGKWTFFSKHGKWTTIQHLMYRSIDLEVAHYCEWDKALSKEALAWVRDEMPSISADPKQDWGHSALLRYVPGEAMA